MRAATGMLRVIAAAVALAGAPVADAADWVIARSPGFLVVSDAGEKQARLVAHQFEQLRALFRQVFKARVDGGQLVVVFAVQDEAGLRKLVGDRGGRAMPAGVFFGGTDKQFVALRLDDPSPNPYRILYHEYVHLLARLNFRSLPVWLNEGLAEFYATADIDDSEVKWGRISEYHIRVFRGSTMIPLRELLAATHDSPLYNEGHRVGPFYAESALLTHYLLLGAPERRGQIGQFVRLLEQDVPEADAIQQAFGDLKKLEKDLFAYSRQIGFHAVKSSVRLAATEIATVRLGPAEADSVRADFFVRRGRLREARALLEPALAASPPPVLAREAMGVLESFAGRRAEALRHLTEAARLAPMSHVAPYRLGLLTMPADPADRARREQALRAAIRINPGFAPAHGALARLLAEGEPPAAEAAVIAGRAVALDPGSAGYRVLHWHVLERLGRKDEAARIEAPLRRAALADGETLAAMAYQLQEVGRGAEAEALLRSARATNSLAASLLGNFLGEQGRWGEAEALEREALAAQPKSMTALNSLAYTLAQGGHGLDEALRLVERALDKGPKNPLYLDTKGFVLLKMERVAEAESLFRQAAADDPDPEILDHLGDALAARGKRQEALAEYERALEAPGLAERLRDAIQAKVNRLQASEGKK